MGKLVRATRTGYHGNRLRYEGAEFEIGDNEAVGSWMEVIDGEGEAPAQPETPAKRGRKPKVGEATGQVVALSELDASGQQVDM